MGHIFSSAAQVPVGVVGDANDVGEVEVKDELPPQQPTKRSYADVVRGRGMNAVHQKQEMCEKV